MRKEWGLGKHEVEALKPEILQHLASGASVVATYKTLKAAGTITVTQRTFERYASVWRDELRAKRQQAFSGVLTPERLATEKLQSTKTAIDGALNDLRKTIERTSPPEASTSEPGAVGKTGKTFKFDMKTNVDELVGDDD